MMRSASMTLAPLVAAALSIPTAASAAPTVTLKAKIAPIPKNLTKKGGPTWPGTGNILGAPAAIQATFAISGKEYPASGEGFPAGTLLHTGPAPLRRIALYLPRGTQVNSAPFKKCPVSKFPSHLKPPCPRSSVASPPGELTAKVFFGKTYVIEKVLVQAYFVPGENKAYLWFEGTAPALTEQYAEGGIFAASGPFSKKLDLNVPLITTVTGAPDATIEQIKVALGAAFTKGKKLVSAIHVPKSCPKAGFTEKAELWFGGGSEPSWQKLSVSTKVRCPKS